MKRMLRVLGLGVVLAALPAHANDSFQVTSLAATSTSQGWSESSALRTHSVSWGPAGPLLPEQEWKPYVTRPAAFFGSLTALDPARIPVLAKSATSRGTSKSGGRSAGASVQSKARPAPAVAADPCAEKVRLALEEAAKTGKIPASSVSPAAGRGGQSPSASSTSSTPSTSSMPSTPSAQSGATPPAPASTGARGAVTTSQIRSSANGQGTYPYDGGASNVAPGTAAQGVSAPSPELGAGAVPAAPTPFTTSGTR